MAVVTIFAKAPFVRILLLMTIKAATGCLAELFRWRVAAGARHHFVSVPEFEIRKRMIERLAVKLDDIGISSLVIGMTVAAFLLRGIELATVKSVVFLTIRGNLFVAIEAEPRLRLSRERLMAVAALLL